MTKLNPDDMPTLVMSDSQDLEAFYSMQARLMFLDKFVAIVYIYIHAFRLFEGLATRYRSSLELAHGRSSCGRQIYSPSSLQGHIYLLSCFHR